MKAKLRHLIPIILFAIILGSPLLQMAIPIIPIAPVWENRSKSVLPAARPADLEDGTFMNGVNGYFNDYYGFRDLFIRTNSWIEYYVFRTPSKPLVIIGKNDFLFSADSAHDYDHIPTLSGQEIDRLAMAFKKIQDTLAGRGIKFMFMVAPNANTIYGEYMPSPPRQPGGSGNAHLLEGAFAKYGVNYMDLVPVLMREKAHSLVYYKHDTH